MKSVAISLSQKTRIQLLIDLFAIAFIYLVPSLSHLLNLPVYFIEPMRLMMVIALAHTHKNNAYLLALTLPLFSYLVSGHPFILKTALISTELLINVWLYYALNKLFHSPALSMLSAILFSKGIYYLLKAGLISFSFIQGGLFATPFMFQILMTLIFSGYIFLVARKKV
jgi:hypothetical protein